MHSDRGKTTTYAHWIQRHSYYHKLIESFYTFTVTPHQRLLLIGSKDGHLLNAFKPSYAIGVEEDARLKMSAQKNYPDHHYYSSLHDIPHTPVDYVVLSSIIMEIDDVQKLLQQLKPFCTERTRIIMDIHSMAWEPLLRAAQYLNLKRSTSLQNWLSIYDISHMLHLAGYEVVTTESHILMPLYIPAISWFCNTILANIPLLNKLCVTRSIIARPIFKEASAKTVSIIIPCRNERGNIEPAIQRIPQFGAAQEIIFIDGHSRDNTYAEMQRVQSAYPHKNIQVMAQPGMGKGDAVHYAFSKASGDVLMILDGDLTMPPEELPKFYDALVQGEGELINGSRLVYGMEDEAMRILNLLANYCFSIGFSWLFGQRVKDTLCGTKVLYKADYLRLKANQSFFGDFDPFGDFDLLFGAAKLNLKIIDMPIRYKNRTYGTTQIRRFYHGIILLKMCIYGTIKLKLKIK